MAARGMRRVWRWRRGLGAVALLLPALACELEETSVTDPADLVVVEAYLTVGERESDLFAYLYRTFVPGREDLGVPGASLEATNEGGARARFLQAPPARCLGAGFGQELDPLLGTCYVGILEGGGQFGPGDRVTLRIQTPRGELLEAATTVPEAFDLLNPEEAGICRIDPDTNVMLEWSAARGTWAYVAETLIFGIREALEARGIEIESDPIYLLGLAVSAEDTDIRFPAEFGVFDRFDLDRELAQVLQTGLPSGTSAVVSIGASDRNSVNWARGGSFNPSGAVRIPSVFGDGTGVFGSAVRRTIEVRAATPDSEEGRALPSCLRP